MEKNLNGGVAHLGERLNGIQEVVGSIPIVSTTGNGQTARMYLSKSKTERKAWFGLNQIIQANMFIENRIKNENETDN